VYRIKILKFYNYFFVKSSKELLEVQKYIFDFHCWEGGFGYKISSPAGIFTAQYTFFVCDIATYWGDYSASGKILDFD
jgi:hypothetical protein